MTKHRGMSRRRLLKVGGLGALGLTLPELLRAEAKGAAERDKRAGTDPVVHPGVLLRRSQPYRHRGYEAQGPGGGPRHSSARSRRARRGCGSASTCRTPRG